MAVHHESTAESDARHMAHDEHAHPTAKVYIQIAIILTIITAVEVFVLYLPEMGLDISGSILVAVFLVLSVAKFLLVVGWYMHRLTLWTLDQFDRVSGLMLGFTSSVIVCHLLVTSVALMGTTKAGPPKYVKQSWLAQEAMSFKTCRQVVRFFNGLRV